MNKKALLVFARTPELGTVKKRLAADIGADQALRCYELLLYLTLSQALQVDAHRFLYFHPQKRESIPGLSAPLSEICSIRCQKPDSDLGTKMFAALSETLIKDKCEQALLVGTDIPFLGNEQMQQAFSLLTSADIVLGPTIDGGYYMVGIRKSVLNQPQIFQEIPWGTNKVLQATVEKATAARLRIKTLSTLFDVDTRKELHTWYQQEKRDEITKQLDTILKNITSTSETL